MTTIHSAFADALGGRYQLERELGRGGMATVYLAQDTRHHRRVAIKVLHPELSAVLGSDRFLKEIELTANLQHPHILPLFDSGEAGGLLYYVMPYVEGESLRSRLLRERQLPVAAAVRIATDVADALAYAHRHGVIHRDIKPENILLHDDRPIVADFGIALAVQHSGGERMTQTGLSLGTPQYMAPEQATGERGVDLRADLYALGAVTYEMLAGEPPYTGPTAQAVVARMLSEEPPSLTARRRSVPEHVEATVLTALEKLPADRFAGAAEFAAALSGASPTRAVAPRVTAAERRRARWRWAAAAVALVLAGAAAATLWTRPTRLPVPSRSAWLEIVPPGGMDEMLGENLLLSPDGSRYVFARGRTGAFDSRLVLRRLDDTTEIELEGTARTVQATWSPDSRSIAFLRGSPLGPRTLLVLPLDGRPPVEVVDSASGLGPWLADDTIVYTRRGVLMGVSVQGGAPRVVRAPDSSGVPSQFRSAAALPGRRLLVTILTPSIDEWKIGVVSLDGGELRVLAKGVSARYVRPDFVLVVQQDGRLLAAPFDTLAGALTGPLRPVLDGVDLGSTGSAKLSVADDGTLLYQGGTSGGVLVAVRRDGTERVLTQEVRNYNDLAVSPDGRWLATGINGLLWSLDLRRGILNRLTPGAEVGAGGLALFPVWRPDGRSVAYVVMGDTMKSVPAEGGEASVFAVTRGWHGSSWSPDGRFLVSAVGSGDLRTLDLRTGTITDFLVSPFTEQAPAFSSDARWVAYVSDESGRPEVYVRRFPDGGGRTRISVDGGSEPAWSTTGAEIFYRGPGGFMAASVEVGDELVVRRLERLFDDSHYQSSLRHREYAVLPGDSAFVFIRRADVGRVFLRFGWEAELDSVLRGT